MTAMELNAEMQRMMSIVNEDEDLKVKVFKYLKKLIAKKEEKDDSLMTEEEFFARVDEARQEIRDGKGVRMRHGETLDELLERTGYGL